jgi:phage terminase large subunit
MKKKKSARKATGVSRKGSNKDKRRDWDQLRHEWALSGQSVREWAKAQKLPISTVRRHIKPEDRDSALAELGVSGDDYKNALTRKLAATGSKRYSAALDGSAFMLQEIAVKASKLFVERLDAGGKYARTEALGNLAIKAAQELRTVNFELAGLPADEDSESYPLTRGFWPFWYQRDFIFDLPAADDIFYFAFIGGIGSGKTRSGAEKFLDICHRNRGRTHAIYGPTYRMLEDVTKPMLFNVLAAKNLSYRYNKTDNSILLFGDTKVLFRSLDNPDHLRGPSLAAVWLDEVGQLRDRKAFDIVSGRIRQDSTQSEEPTPEPCCLITTTPKGFNWLYEILTEDADDKKAKIYYAETEWNKALGPDYYKRLLTIYDERFAEQELRGKFIELSAGAAYWNFARKDHVYPKARIKYDPGLPLILCCDFNVDPMCWNIIQEPTPDQSWIIDEMHLRTAGTEIACKEFISRYGDHKSGVLVYGDSSSRKRTTNATRTDYVIIKNHLKPMVGVDIKLNTSNPVEMDRIGAVNARLLDATGRRHLFFSEKCKHTIKDFEKVVFKPGTRSIEKDATSPELTHHSDAIGYYIYRKWPIRGVRIAHN